MLCMVLRHSPITPANILQPTYEVFLPLTEGCCLHLSTYFDPQHKSGRHLPVPASKTTDVKAQKVASG